MLTAHNSVRAEVRVPAAALDQALMNAALAYAEELAVNGKFEHSAAGTRQGQGENLWAGTAVRFTYQQMSGAWIDEKTNFLAGRFPDVSRSGNWQDVGHYTQIIWRSSTKIGCGIATGGGRDVLVCRYSPAGNVVGELVP